MFHPSSKEITAEFLKINIRFFFFTVATIISNASVDYSDVLLIFIHEVCRVASLA